MPIENKDVSLFGKRKSKYLSFFIISETYETSQERCNRIQRFYFMSVQKKF